MDLVGRTIDWWRRRHITAARFVRARTVAQRSELPLHLHRRTLYVVGTMERPKWAIIVCPCGRNHQIDLPTTPGPTGKQWDLTADSTGVTVHPSVDVQAATRCHFWLRKGTVQWV